MFICKWLVVVHLSFNGICFSAISIAKLCYQPLFRRGPHSSLLQSPVPEIWKIAYANKPSSLRARIMKASLSHSWQRLLWHTLQAEPLLFSFCFNSYYTEKEVQSICTVRKGSACRVTMAVLTHKHYNKNVIKSLQLSLVWIATQ